MSTDLPTKPTCGKCGEPKPLEYCRPCWKRLRADLKSVEVDSDKYQWEALTQISDLMKENAKLRREIQELKGTG